MRPNWKLFAIIIVLALGFLFEFLKSADFKNKNQLITAQDLGHLDFQPYSRKKVGGNSGQDMSPEMREQMNKFNLQRQRGLQARGQNYKFPEEHSFSHKMPTSPPIDPEAKENGKVSELAKKANAKLEKDKKTREELKKKKAKADAAKKKKAADEADKKAQEEIAGDDQAKKEEEAEAQAADLNDRLKEFVPPVLPFGQVADKNDTPDAEEWIRRVLSQPSLEETSALIKYKQSNLVTPEVFYLVVQQMLEDPRQRMRELGIVAVNSTPSYRSFVMLAQFLQDEVHGSGVRGKAAQALDRYSQLPYLNVIESVYRSQESALIREKALHVLMDSARKNLASQKTPPQPNPSEQSVANPLIQRYTDILAQLEQMLAGSAESSQVTSALQNAVEGLKSLLSA